jgi:hypothetical protein
MIKAVLDFVAAIAAFGAASFWFMSAATDFPAPGTYWDSIPETDPWLIANRKSARQNKLAAKCAGVSALATCISISLGLLKS